MLEYAPVVTLERRLEFDVFISHAWEDKDDFVRPLARALEARRLRPWYDEFTLRPGDSLRRSIDHGLLTSQAGIVVLSPAFFAKRWTAYELDGLVQLDAGSPDQVAGHGQGSRIIPVWHDVGAEEVTGYSPSLANLVAIMSREGVEAVADRILEALRPTGSTLLFAYTELAELGAPTGWYPPLITDDWWLDAVEASTPTGVEGTFQDAMGWGHWGFPLPEKHDDPRQRGHRLARAAAQMMWQRAAEAEHISQVTPPEKVMDFISSHPGLDEACVENPSFLLSYAPQLAIPGVADWLQETIDETYEWARNGVRKRGFSPDTLEGMANLVDRTSYLVLRDVELVRAKRSAAAGSWVQGDIMGPPVKVHQTVDYAGWLVSDTSAWMGDEMRTELVAGIAEWGTWPGWRDDSLTGDDVAQLYELLEGDLSDRSTVQHIRDLLAVRLSTTAQILGLDEAGDTLADRLVAAGLVETYSRRIGKRAK